MKVGEWEHPTDKGNGQRQHTPINVNNVLTETIVVYISIPGTTLQPQGDEPGQRDTFLCTQTLLELQQIPQELSDESRRMGTSHRQR